VIRRLCPLDWNNRSANNFGIILRISQGSLFGQRPNDVFCTCKEEGQLVAKEGRYFGDKKEEIGLPVLSEPNEELSFTILIASAP